MSLLFSELEMALMNLTPIEKHRTRRRSSRSPRKRSHSGRSSISDVSDMETDPPVPDRSHKLSETTKHDIASTNGANCVGQNLPNGNGISDGISSRLGAGDVSVLTKELQIFIQEALSESNPVSMSELRNKLSMYTARVPAAHVFSSGVSDRMIEDAVVAIGGFRLNNQVMYYL